MKRERLTEAEFRLAWALLHSTWEEPSDQYRYFKKQWELARKVLVEGKTIGSVAEKTDWDAIHKHQQTHGPQSWPPSELGRVGQGALGSLVKNLRLQIYGRMP